MFTWMKIRFKTTNSLFFSVCFNNLLFRVTKIILLAEVPREFGKFVVDFWAKIVNCHVIIVGLIKV